MIDVAGAWLKSGKHAAVAGLRLRPVENQLMKGIPLAPVRGQAQAFYLKDDNSYEWILKKFLPAKIPSGAYIKAIQSLIPSRPGFQSGYLRRVLTGADVSRSDYFTPEFASWIENTVLMPRIKCDDWAGLADMIRRGSVTLTDNERLLLCKSLSEAVAALEGVDISHRDLSPTNVFVDVKAALVHFIDWDCVFHPSLSMPANTTFGSDGYTAPFVKGAAGPDPRATWGPHADRFGMAILNAEFLCMDVGTPLRNDGGMFEQSELYSRGGPETTAVIDALRKRFPEAARLLEAALAAQGFDDCPSPAEWLALGKVPGAPSPYFAPMRTTAAAAAARPNAAPAAPLGSFVPLDEAAFVELDEGAFVTLN